MQIAEAGAFFPACGCTDTESSRLPRGRRATSCEGGAVAAVTSVAGEATGMPWPGWALALPGSSKAATTQRIAARQVTAHARAIAIRTKLSPAGRIANYPTHILPEMGFFRADSSACRENVNVSGWVYGPQKCGNPPETAAA